jgi:hypothetical protein
MCVCVCVLCALCTHLSQAHQHHEVAWTHVEEKDSASMELVLAGAHVDECGEELVCSKQCKPVYLVTVMHA